MIVEPASGQPVVAGRASGWRVPLIALVAVAAVAVGAVAGAVLLMGRSAGLGASAEYVPADSVMYLEAHLDLPGAQREQLRGILERFPGVKPDEILGEALGETLDKALSDANAPFDYTTDVAPWFNGQVAFALLDYPVTADPMAMELPSMVALLGVRDPAAATAFADRLRRDLEADGASFTSSDHGGTTIWTLDLGDVPLGMPPGAGFAYAVTNDQLVLASGVTEVTTALDVRAGNGASLSDRAEVRQLGGRLPEERAGVFTLDVGAMLAELRAQLESSQPGLADALGGSLDSIPTFSISSISFEADSVRFDSVSTVPDGASAPENAERGFASQVPSDAIFFADGDGLGTGLEQAVTSLKAALAVGPTGPDQLAQLEQFEAALGADLEQFVSWIGGGAVVAGSDGEEPYFGLVLEAADADAARQRMNQLRALAELAALDPTAGVTVTTETVGSVEVTTIRADLSSAGMLGVPTGAVIEWAIDGDRVLVGVGDRLVRRLLALDPADSLAQTSRFRTAVERFGGAQNSGVVYLDVAALREAVVSVVPPEMLTEYQKTVAPNLEPLDYLVSVTRVEGDGWVSRMALVLK
jgi:uncharacterized protein DUF3352